MTDGRFRRAPNGAARPAGVAAPPRKRKLPHVATPVEARRARRRARWPLPTARSRDWSVRYGLLAYVGTEAFLFAMAAVMRLAGGPHIPAASGALLVDLTLLGGLAPLARAGRVSPRDLGFRRAPAGRSVGLVVLALVATVGLDELFVSILHPRTVNPFGGIAQQSTLAIVTAGLAACVTAPVVEEIFFRGLIYRCLRNRCSTLPAALVAAILFAGVHAPSYSPGALPGIACFGLIACLLYERTGSLLPGIALHSLIDANVFEVNLTGHAGVVLVVFLLLGLGLLARGAFTTARRRRTRRTAAG